MAHQQEWIGGTVPAPAILSGGEISNRPEVSLWLEADGPVVGMAVEPPGERCGPTVALLRQSMMSPLAGVPRRPSRVRVAEGELAEALRSEFGAELEVTVGETPELAEVMASLGSLLSGETEQLPEVLKTAGTNSKSMASFFAAAARLFRAAPWRLFPRQRGPITLNIEALGVRDQVVSLMGARGQALGLLVLQSRRDLDRVLGGMEPALQADDVATLPPYLSLEFKRLDELPTELREEAATRGWEVASQDAYPVVLAALGTEMQLPTARDFQLLEALSNGLADWVSGKPELKLDLKSGRGLDRAFEVTSSGELLSVRFTVGQVAPPIGP